jgi:DNA-binding phage protein
MSVSTVSSTSAAAATGQAQRPDPMANVAKLLNMSSSDLRDALKSGSSLSDVAAKQGVSRDDLLKTISSDLQNRPARPGQTAPTSDDVAAEAAKIADTKGLPQHHGHHKHGGASGGITPATTSASTVSAQASTGSVDVLL